MVLYTFGKCVQLPALQPEILIKTSPVYQVEVLATVNRRVLPHTDS